MNTEENDEKFIKREEGWHFSVICTQKEAT